MGVADLKRRTEQRKAAGLIPARYPIAAPVPAQTSSRPLPVLPCVHLGAPTAPPDRQPTARIWRTCDHPAKPLGAAVCPCMGCGPKCSGYEADSEDEESSRFACYPPVRRRHLVYHLLPISGNGVWQRSVDQLRLRWSLFTGRKIVSIVTGQAPQEQGTDRQLSLDSPETVRRYLPPDCEIIQVANDPTRWELVSWQSLWDRVLKDAHPDDAILYAHAKGVTRPLSSTCHQWADVITRLALDHWPTTAELLEQHPIVGPFKKLGWLFGAPMDQSKFHFSGNFWWVRAAEIRAKLAAVPVPLDRWACEAWVGIAWKPEEAGCIGAELNHGGADDLYKTTNWEQLSARLAAWTSAHPPQPFTAAALAQPRDGVRLSVIVPTTGRPTLARTLASITPQLLPGDEVLIERDSTGDWGATPRMSALQRAAGDYVMFMDDDDVYAPGAFATVRAALREKPNRPHLFTLRRGGPFHDLIPRAGSPRRVACGNISTECIVTPNDPARLGTWGITYTGDYDFIASTVALYPADSVVWHDDVIAIWRPEE